MLKEKVEQSDLVLYEILRHPVLCCEFIYNLDKTESEEKFEFHSYQKEMLCDFNSYSVFCTGRSIGKTLVLTSIIIWYLVNNIFPNDYCVFACPSRVHLEPVWNNLVRYFRSNSFLKQLIARGAGINASEFSIKLLNGTFLICRIAGQSGTGANLIGLHSSLVLVEEAGYFPWNAFQEMQPSVNTWVSGFREVVAGVPTGIRERNVLYNCDQENPIYTKHRISADDNPRLTEIDQLRAIEQFGGEDSDDFTHLWKGLHGKPVFTLFDRNLMEISDYPVYQLLLDGTKYYDNLLEYVNKLSIFPGLPDRDSQCLFGIDLGYTEATAINILYLDTLGRLKFHGRIKCNRVNYFIQEKIIDWLDTKFKPIIIGIDEGSAGKAVIPRLQEHDDFLHKNYKKRIIPINFSSSIVLGKDSEGNEIKTKTKPFSVGILQDYSNNHKIIYSYKDLDLVTELERMTYTKTPTGEIVYRTLTERGGKRGEDHFTQALLCGVLAYYLTHETLEFSKGQKKLAHSRWNLTYV